MLGVMATGKGVLLYTCHMLASPETITEVTPRVPVPMSHQHSPLDVVRLDLGRDRAQDQVLAQELTPKTDPTKTWHPRP